MAEAGAITFRTDLDNAQLEKGLKEAEKQVNEIRRRLEEATSSRNGLEEQFQGAEQAAKKAEQQVESLTKKLESQEFEQTWIERMMGQANESIEEAKARASELEAQLSAMGDPDAMNADQLAQATQIMRQLTEQYEAISRQRDEVDKLDKKWREAFERVSLLKDKLVEAEGAQERLRDEAKELGARYDEASNEVKELTADLGDAERRATDLGNRYAQAVASAEKGTDAATSALDRFASKMGSMLNRVFVFGVILKALNAIRSAVGEGLMANQQFSATWANLTATVQGFAAGLANVVLPVVLGVVRATAAAIATLARLIDSVLGTSLMKAISGARKSSEEAWRQTDESKAAARQAEQIAKQREKAAERRAKAEEQYAERAAKAQQRLEKAQRKADERLADAEESAAQKNADAQAAYEKKVAKAEESAARKAEKAEERRRKAADRLRKAQERANQSLLSFDEINKLNEDTAEDAADAIEDEGDAYEDFELKTYDIDPSDYEVDPDDYAIDPFDWDEEAFEDVYPADFMQPDWDSFDVGRIDAKLAEIMLVLGAALLAVGAILCFSGINIPLGITLMAIGALMMYTAVSESWETLPQEVRDAITGLLVLTGLVLLTLGLILALSGANVPLGVGMMVAGALELWAAVAINWDDLPEEVRGPITAIMALVGAALLAVGAIITLSGANVPLGIALMVAGALDLAAVVAINWDSMPEEVKAAVTVVAAILGGSLLVIGAILALTGANLPLGIGLIAVGAVALGTAVALNWDTIKDRLEEVLPIIEASVGGALLVIGAVLAFSGANVPLGIGLLAVGAITLGKAIIENWDKVPDDVKGVIAILELIVGTALLVVGAVLVFSAANIPLGLGLLATGALAIGNALTDNWNKIPDDVKAIIATLEVVVGTALLTVGALLCLSAVNIPLGLALLAAGALALAHVATLNWDELPDGVKEKISMLAAFIGGALLVLGVILCLTGVGIPLGVACIIAGVAALVADVVLNWDFLVNKVKEIWGQIKQFWHTNIERIFTWEWWSNLFKSIVNGLIEQINNGLNAFGGFINGLASGVGDILDFFGVEGWSFSLGMPQIPYLAQGAVIPPNREFLAVLGDQKSGTNIETPEALLRQVVREETGPLLADAVAALLGGSGGQQQRDVVLRVGRKELARETIYGINELSATGELGDGLIVFA